jgi:hypothetical protein
MLPEILEAVPDKAHDEEPRRTGERGSADDDEGKSHTALDCDGLRPSASDRAPMLCGIAVGVMQAATPLAFWWLDSATIYALGLVVIASIYVGFAVADRMAVRRVGHASWDLHSGDCDHGRSLGDVGGQQF